MEIALALLGLPAEPKACIEFIEGRLQYSMPHWRAQVGDMVLCVLVEIPELLRRNEGRADFHSYSFAALTYCTLCCNAWDVCAAQAPIGLFIGPAILNYLRDPDSVPLPQIQAISGLFRRLDSPFLCGFQPLNTVSMRDQIQVPVFPGPLESASYTKGADTGEKEGFRPYFRSPQKCVEFQRKLEQSDFELDWRRLKTAFPEETAQGDLLRENIPLDTHFGSAFLALCWKYLLVGVSAQGEPILCVPSVRQTPFGTEIFVPSYMSVDFKRDFDLGAIADLHRARGVARQGEAFSASRTEEVARAAKAIAADTEARAGKLRGEARLAYIRTALGLPETTDDAVIGRLIRLGKRQASKIS